jgi:hypothetical protein
MVEPPAVVGLDLHEGKFFPTGDSMVNLMDPGINVPTIGRWTRNRSPS